MGWCWNLSLKNLRSPQLRYFGSHRHICYEQVYLRSTCQLTSNALRLSFTDHHVYLRCRVQSLLETLVQGAKMLVDRSGYKLCET